MILSLKITAIAAAVAFAAGGLTGWRTAKAFSDSQHYKDLSESYARQVASLQDDVRKINRASLNDQERAAIAEARRVEAEELANALQSRITDGVCFSAGDVDGLRGLWKPPARRKPR